MSRSLTDIISSMITKCNQTSGRTATTLTQGITDIIDTSKKVYNLGTAKSFNVKSILTSQGVSKPDSFYQGLTANDFLLQGTPSLSSGSWYGTGSHNGSMSITKSYNSSTFVLTMQSNLHVSNSGSNTGGSDYYTGSVNAYLVA